MQNAKTWLPSLAAVMFVVGWTMLVMNTGGHSAFYIWSKTAASNATVDSSINFAEGQAPSSVNDSSRAVMARLAEYRDDMAGSITTGGTSTAYTVTTNQVFDTLAHLSGQKLCFVMSVTNGATVTLAVDGLTAKPLRSAPSTELGAGVLISGSPYCAVYNNSNAEFYVEGFLGNPYNVPLGAILAYTGSSAPNSNFVLAYGQAVSRTTYATYFSQVSTNYGIGDGVTTFNVPDLRGRFIAGIDNMGGSAANRMTNAATGCGVAWTSLASTTVCGSESHTLTTAELAAHTHTQTTQQPTFTYNSGTATTGGSGPYITQIAASGQPNTITTTGVAPGNSGSTGSGTAHAIVPPAIGLNYILRLF